jgi:hypothetical protein
MSSDDFDNPTRASSKNSNVKCDSVCANLLLVDTIKLVLLDGIHKSSNYTMLITNEIKTVCAALCLTSRIQ